jgi:hypothetical protein
MLKPYQKFPAARFYEEVLSALSPYRPESKETSPAPTDPIRLRLLAYAAKSRKLDTLLGKLGAKEFCACDCAKSPGGCCWEYAYRMGNEDFFEFLALQEVEARKNGWARPGKRCRYHSDIGCKLSLFKAPVCIRLLCPPLVKSLEKRFGRPARDFNDALARLSPDIQRSETLLGEMDYAIALGQRIPAR